MSKLQTTGLKRDTIDKYYTKKNIAKHYVNIISKNIQINNNDTIIEPSAGNGVFIKYIKKLTKNYEFYDIEPEHKSIIKMDFLQYNNKTNNTIHIIGNPPFGRQSSLAIKFIKKCCEFSTSISFILPKSFKKHSMQKCFDEYFHLIYEEDVDENSFIVNNIETNVPCVFQIWKKSNIKRNIEINKIPEKFIFVKKSEQPHISFRRVGVNAGNISEIITDKSEQSHYFIKFNNNNIKENITKLNKLKFEFNNTVGPKSISKPELIDQFNKLL